MSNWREHLWVKIIALTIAGVFLFSEVTWAARADFSLSLPQISLSPYNNSSNTNWRDSLWQIYKNITSFLAPAAHAYEIMDHSARRMPESFSPWTRPSAMDTTSMTTPEEESLEPVTQPLENPSVESNDTVIDTVANEIIEFINSLVNLILDYVQRIIPAQEPAVGEETTTVVVDNTTVVSAPQLDTATPAGLTGPLEINPGDDSPGFIFDDTVELPDAARSPYQGRGPPDEPPINPPVNPPQVEYEQAINLLSQLLPEVSLSILAEELAVYTEDGMVSLEGILQIASQHGLITDISHLSFEELKDLNTPIICHLVNLEDGLDYYVIITEGDFDDVVIEIEPESEQRERRTELLTQLRQLGEK